MKKSLICYVAFVAILFGNIGQKSREHNEASNQLKPFLLNKLHQAELQGKTKTPSPKRKNINQETPVTPTVVHNDAPNPGSTPLSARGDLSPLKHLITSPIKSGKTSNELVQKEKDLLAAHNQGRRWR